MFRKGQFNNSNPDKVISSTHCPRLALKGFPTIIRQQNMLGMQLCVCSPYVKVVPFYLASHGPGVVFGPPLKSLPQLLGSSDKFVDELFNYFHFLR